MGAQINLRQKLLLVATALVALATLLPFLDFNFWLIRIWDFPRPQILALTLVLSVALFVLDKPDYRLTPVLSAVLLCVLLIQTNRILPYTPLGAREVQDTERLASERNIVVLGANVLMTNRNADPLLRQIEEVQPSLILLTECDQQWLDALATVTKDYPYKVEEPITNTYGMALYSKFRLIDPEVKYLLEDDIPSIHSKVLLPSGELFKLYCVHPRPPAPQESDSTAQRDAELILVAKESSKLEGLPVIVIGDLNDVAWSPTTRHFQAQSGLLDPRKGRGLYSTFHADIPLLRFPLDHIFFSSHFRLAQLKVMPYIGSDHFPILANLSLEDSAPVYQPTPTPTPGTQEETERTIEEGIEEEKAENSEG